MNEWNGIIKIPNLSTHLFLTTFPQSIVLLYFFYLQKFHYNGTNPPLLLRHQSPQTQSHIKNQSTNTVIPISPILPFEFATSIIYFFIVLPQIWCCWGVLNRVIKNIKVDVGIDLDMDVGVGVEVADG
ncbi:hypothetical protein BKA69DRAFT_1127406 [Paraphysoderma sedebokerense]|nr:hypothetical protein BKA69DRAFT_1127406 [Paraphysoderma sedebokerense]